MTSGYRSAGRLRPLVSADTDIDCLSGEWRTDTTTTRISVHIRRITAKVSIERTTSSIRLDGSRNGSVRLDDRVERRYPNGLCGVVLTVVSAIGARRFEQQSFTKGDAVPNRRLVCACGYEIVAATDAEVRRVARRQIDEFHPELFRTDAELDAFLRENIRDE